MIAAYASCFASATESRDALAARLDELEFALGEGPGRIAFREGYQVLIPDVRDEASACAGRWPAFSRAAAETAARAMFALPLQLGAIRVGVVLLHRRDPGTLDRAGLQLALRIGCHDLYPGRHDQGHR